MKTVLVVEDDKNINEMLGEVLHHNNYNVKSAYSGTEALLVMNKDIDLVLLDLMLPGKNGEEIINELKKIKNIPVIVMSAITDIEKKLDLFKLGAEDYVTKPFNNEELLAGIKVHLKKENTLDSDVIKINEIELNTKTYTIAVNGNNINLSKTEFEILKLLMQNSNKVVTKSIIFDTVWDNFYSADDNTLNVHISKIRNKLKKAGAKDYIETIWSIGYKFKN